MKDFLSFPNMFQLIFNKSINIVTMEALLNGSHIFGVRMRQRNSRNVYLNTTPNS